jgi:heme-degrading monooxygenase HmoA
MTLDCGPKGGQTMGDVYTSGTWKPKPGSEEAFIEAWAEFAAWGSGMVGAGTLRLTRDLDDPERFLSFGDWETSESARAWKDAPEFRERIGTVLQHCDEFHSANYQVVASATAGSSTTAAPA